MVCVTVLECRFTDFFVPVLLVFTIAAFYSSRKPNEETNYIHISSDHLSSTIKEIPWSIEKRLTILSSSKDIFQESAIYYEKCLKDSGKKTTKRKQSKQKEKNVTSFVSIHHTASPLKPISGEYSRY